MTIEITILIAALSLAFSIFFGLSNQRRTTRASDQAEESRMTTLMIKMEHLSGEIAEIKADVRNMGALGERVTVSEQSTKQAHKRIDEIAVRIERLEGQKREENSI